MFEVLQHSVWLCISFLIRMISFLHYIIIFIFTQKISRKCFRKLILITTFWAYVVNQAWGFSLLELLSVKKNKKKKTRISLMSWQRNYMIYHLLWFFRASRVVLVIKNPLANAGDMASIPGSGKPLWKGKWQPAPVFLPGKSHGQRSLMTEHAEYVIA